jgi:hypothetical protein
MRDGRDCGKAYIRGMALSLLDPDEYHDATETVGTDAFLSNRNLACDLIPAIQRLGSRKPRRGMTAKDG